MHEKPHAEGSVLEPEITPEALAPAPADDGDRRSGPAPDARLDRSLALTILTVLAVFYSLYFARAFLVPITFAVLLNFLLSPVVRTFGRARIPAPIAAAVVILTIVGGLVLGVYQVAGPTQAWIDKAPQALATAQRQLKNIIRPLEKVTRTAEQVDRATDSGSGPKTPEVVVKSPSMSAILMSISTTEYFSVR